MNVSLREIAAETGLSRMAVSLALRGKPGVSEANRKMVLKVAKRLGYEPDPELAKMLTHLRRNKSQNCSSCLALLTSGPVRKAWKSSVTEKQYVVGVQERAKSYGYRSEEFWINEPGMRPERLENILWNRGIEGVVLAPLLSEIKQGSSTRIDLDLKRFSVVEISETISWPNFDRTLHDQYTAMQCMIHELRRLGYQRLGLAMDASLHRRVNGKWTAAYLEDSLLHPETRAKPFLAENESVTPFKRWMQKEKPDVIISVDGFGKRLLDKIGLQIPRDIAYASLDLDGIDPERTFFSGIDQNSYQTGSAAVDLLVSAIQRGERGMPSHPRRLQIEGSWILGNSTPDKS